MRAQLALFTLLVLIALSGCKLAPETPPTPTMDVTQVYETVAAKLTQAQAAVTPTPTQSGTPTPKPTTGTPLSPATAILPSPSATPTASPGGTTSPNDCNRAAAGIPIDITIPDDTEMSPGESFIKIWKLENVGSCTWTLDYAASFFSGEQMGAPDSVPLGETVPPGQSVEISVEMVAPLIQGTYQGNWKLSSAAGILFGIGPNSDSPFWVRIVVVQPPTETPTPTQIPTFTPTPTQTPPATPTPTATPEVEVNQALALALDDLVDLDTAQVNADSDNDLVYQADESDFHWLVPQAGATLGVYGGQQPGIEICQNASMSTAPIPVESLSQGTYLCYLTNQGRLGWALLTGFDEADYTLDLEILTWALP